MMKAQGNRKALRIIIYIFLLIQALITIFPFFWALATSLKSEAESIATPPILWPEEIQIQNYIDAWSLFPFGRFYLNTLFVSIFTTIGILLTSILAGYALAKFDFKLKKPILIIIIATMMIPYWINIVPVYILLTKLKWIDTYRGLIIPQIANPLGIFLMRQYMLSIPNDYIDAGRIDGANEWRILWKIMVPQCIPVIATLAIYMFVTRWNSFLWPLIVTRSMEMRTVTVGLALLSGSPQRTQYALQMAAATIGLIPPIIVFLFLQKYLTKGTILSGLKG